MKKIYARNNWIGSCKRSMEGIRWKKKQPNVSGSWCLWVNQQYCRTLWNVWKSESENIAVNKVMQSMTYLPRRCWQTDRRTDTGHRNDTVHRYQHQHITCHARKKTRWWQRENVTTVNVLSQTFRCCWWKKIKRAWTCKFASGNFAVKSLGKNIGKIWPLYLTVQVNRVFFETASHFGLFLSSSTRVSWCINPKEGDQTRICVWS